MDGIFTPFYLQHHAALLFRRIRGRETVARDLPRPRRILLEYEKLLVAFNTLRACSVNGCCAGRVRADEDPLWRHLHHLSDLEFDVQRDRFEHRVVRLAYRFFANRRLAVWR